VKIRRNLMIIAAALILICSFFLPNAVAGVTDMRRLDSLTMIDSQSISFDFASELSLPERLALAASPNTERLPVITGNSMNEEAAATRAARELARFFRGAEFGPDYHDLSIADGSAALIIDTVAPSQNMIVWEFDMYDPVGNSVNVTIDDETGAIVRLIYIMSDRIGFRATWESTRMATDRQLFSVAQSLTEMMAEYYGITVELSDYQYSGDLSYYRADIESGGLVVPMYGVVRATNFTMNERLYTISN